MNKNKSEERKEKRKKDSISILLVWVLIIIVSILASTYITLISYELSLRSTLKEINQNKKQILNMKTNTTEEKELETKIVNLLMYATGESNKKPDLETNEETKIIEEIRESHLKLKSIGLTIITLLAIIILLTILTTRNLTPIPWILIIQGLITITIIITINIIIISKLKGITKDVLLLNYININIVTELIKRTIKNITITTISLLTTGVTWIIIRAFLHRRDSHQKL